MISSGSFDIQTLFASRLLLPAHTTKEDVEQYMACWTDKAITQDESDELCDEENEWLEKAILRRPIF